MSERVCFVCSIGFTESPRGLQSKYCSDACYIIRDFSVSLEETIRIITSASSYAQACRSLSAYSSKSHRVIGCRVHDLTDFLKLDVSHYDGQAWSKGTSKITLEEFYEVCQEKVWRTGWVKYYLYRFNLKEKKCEWCGITSWRDLPAPLSLDHIDGDKTNNLIDNLRILCENCHAQTPTWRGRNKNYVQ